MYAGAVEAPRTRSLSRASLSRPPATETELFRHATYTVYNQRFLWIQRAFSGSVSLILAGTSSSYRISLKRKIVSPILLMTLSLMTVMPEASSLFAHASLSGTVSVNPSFAAGDVGSTFPVEVDISGVPNMLAYDVSLDFNPASLQAMSVDFDTSTVVAGTSHFNVVTITDNGIGEVRYAVSLLSGATVDASGSVPALKMTLKVVGAVDSPLNIDPLIAELVNGVATPVTDITVNNGVFLVPPNILIVPPNSDVAPSFRLRRISKGEDHVNLIGYIQLDPNAIRPGFGGVVFDIVGPGGEVQIPSTIAFMFPGNSTTVTASFFYPLDSSSIGTYTYSVLALRCATPDACVTGAMAFLSLDGPFFKVKA